MLTCITQATTYDADARPRIKKVLQRLQELSKTYVDPEPVDEVAEPPVAPIVASRTAKSKAAPAVGESNGNDDDKHRLTKSKKKHKDRGGRGERPTKKDKKRDEKRDEKKDKKVDKKEPSEKKKERKRTTSS